ncbi:MAG: tripartite tricarboxylate transporter substrate-binding protein [Acidobacteriota bacterium]
MKPFVFALESYLAACVFAALSVFAAQPTIAQGRYPSQPIKIAVPYAPGGSTGLIARQSTEQPSRVGQTVLVDIKPGGGTNIGAESVAQSKADGDTLLFANNNQVLNPIFGPVSAFDSSALTPISLVSRVAFITATNPKTPFNTGAELLAAAKAALAEFTSN